MILHKLKSQHLYKFMHVLSKTHIALNKNMLHNMF
jgi:hypothetical protein